MVTFIITLTYNYNELFQGQLQDQTLNLGFSFLNLFSLLY